MESKYRIPYHICQWCYKNVGRFIYDCYCVACQSCANNKKNWFSEPAKCYFCQKKTARRFIDTKVAPQQAGIYFQDTNIIIANLAKVNDFQNEVTKKYCRHLQNKIKKYQIMVQTLTKFIGQFPQYRKYFENQFNQSQMSKDKSQKSFQSKSSQSKYNQQIKPRIIPQSMSEKSLYKQPPVVKNINNHQNSNQNSKRSNYQPNYVMQKPNYVKNIPYINYQQNEPRINHIKNDTRKDPRIDQRIDPRIDRRIDPRIDQRIDPRTDPRIDPLIDNQVNQYFQRNSTQSYKSKKQSASKQFINRNFQKKNTPMLNLANERNQFHVYKIDGTAAHKFSDPQRKLKNGSNLNMQTALRSIRSEDQKPYEDSPSRRKRNQNGIHNEKGQIYHTDREDQFKSPNQQKSRRNRK